MTTTDDTDRAGGRGLPAGAADALAAAVGPRLRNHPARLARPHDPEAPDHAVWDTAGRAEVLDALWDAGLLAVPGGKPRPPLYREPPDLAGREALVDMVADALDPILRAGAVKASNGSAWVGEQSARDLATDATFPELVAALHEAGLLVFDHADDRAYLRSGWAAMGSALHTLARHEDLSPDLLARVPKSHVTYLLGQQAARQQLREAWGRVEAAKMLLATIRDRHDGDLGYLRTNLAVLQGLLAGRVHWSLGEPRDAGEPADASLYDEVRHRAGRVAVDSERLFAAVGDAMIGQPGRRPDPALSVQHLFAHRAALYAWGVAALLGYIREQLGDEPANDAAAIVDSIGENGDPPYVDDLPRAEDGPGEYADLVAGWAAAGGPTPPRPTREEWATAAGIAGELRSLEDLALDAWRRADWPAVTAALTAPLRELLADAADRAIARYNTDAQAAGYTGMRPVDRWWRTGEHAAGGAAAAAPAERDEDRAAEDAAGEDGAR